MAVKQEIVFHSDANYFAGFLQSLITQSGIQGAVSQKNGIITLYIGDLDTQNLGRFEALVSKYLPHSLFLGEIQSSNDTFVFTDVKFHSKSYSIAPCAQCLEGLTDPASSDYLDETKVCTHYSNTKNEGESAYPSYSYSPHYGVSNTLLITDFNQINRLFYLTQEEQKALFSIEKPTLKVTIKDEALQALTGKKFIFVRAPFDMRSALAALNAKEAEIPYLFFKEEKWLQAAVLKNEVMIVRDEIGVSKSIQNLSENPIVNRMRNIALEAGFNDIIAANLSTKNGLSFLVDIPKSAQKTLSLGTFDLSNCLAQMHQHESYGRLLKNFSAIHNDAFVTLESGFYGLFESLCIVLGLEEKSYEALSDKAMEFKGNGGLKIDTHFTSKGLDYTALIASVISFRLADVQSHYLAYSIFESLGDMVIATLGELKKEFGRGEFVMMGDMFSNSVLHSRILSKFAMHNPYFPKGIALDD